MLVSIPEYEEFVCPLWLLSLPPTVHKQAHGANWEVWTTMTEWLDWLLQPQIVVQKTINSFHNWLVNKLWSQTRHSTRLATYDWLDYKAKSARELIPWSNVLGSKFLIQTQKQIKKKDKKSSVQERLVWIFVFFYIENKPLWKINPAPHLQSITAMNIKSLQMAPENAYNNPRGVQIILRGWTGRTTWTSLHIKPQHHNKFLTHYILIITQKTDKKNEVERNWWNFDFKMRIIPWKCIS